MNCFKYEIFAHGKPNVGTYYVLVNRKTQNSIDVRLKIGKLKIKLVNY